MGIWDKLKARNWNAVSALLRTGGPMRSQEDAPRRGGGNESRDLISEYEEDLEEDEEEGKEEDED